MTTALLVGIIASVSIPQDSWPVELEVPTVSEFEAHQLAIGGDVLYNREGRIISLFDGAAYDETARTWLKTLTDPSALPKRLRPVTDGMHLNAIMRWRGIWSSTVTYRGSSAGTMQLSVVRYPSIERASRQFETVPEDLTVPVRRAKSPGVTIGDDYHFVYHGQGVHLEFRVGDHIITVNESAVELAQAEANCIVIGRAIELRLYANKQVGDFGEEFTLRDGRKVRGIRSPHRYVPLKNLEKLGINVTSFTDAEPRYAIIKRGSRTAKVTEFAETLGANGNATACPPAIPFDGDLWVPLTATLRALGLAER